MPNDHASIELRAADLAQLKKKVTAKKKTATKKSPVVKKSEAPSTSKKAKAAANKKAAAKRTPIAKKAASKKTTKKITKKTKTNTAKKVVAKKKPVAKKTATKKKVTPKKSTAKKVTKKASPKAERTSTTAKKKAAQRKQKVAATPLKTKSASVAGSTRRATVAKAATVQPAVKPPRKRSKAKRSSAPRAVVATSEAGGIFIPYQETKGEEYMNDDQVEHFRQILLGWKQQLMQEVDRTLIHMQDEAANFPDPNDRATQESEFTLELRTRDRERKLIKKIDEAMATLDTGDYGFCETCGVEIGIRRLEARPTASQCIDCKVLDEIRERQMG